MSSGRGEFPRCSIGLVGFVLVAITLKTIDRMVGSARRWLRGVSASAVHHRRRCRACLLTRIRMPAWSERATSYVDRRVFPSGAVAPSHRNIWIFL